MVEMTGGERPNDAMLRALDVDLIGGVIAKTVDDAGVVAAIWRVAAACVAVEAAARART